MKSTVSIEIRTNVFVARDAERRARLIGIRIVTSIAVGFDFGVTFNHTAGHQ